MSLIRTAIPYLKNEKIEEINVEESGSFLKGLRYGILLSLPVWVVIILLLKIFLF